MSPADAADARNTQAVVNSAVFIILSSALCATGIPEVACQVTIELSKLAARSPSQVSTPRSLSGPCWLMPVNPPLD
jgi:hypothetical protein